MSTSVFESFRKAFERDVHDEFQRRGSKLRGTVRSKDKVEGLSTTFQRIGSGEATTKARHGIVTPMNVDHDPVECTLKDFYAGDWVDKLDELKVAHDERDALVRAGAWGLGRKADALVIDAMDGATNAVGDHTSGLTKTLLLEAFEALNAADVPDDGQRYGLLSPHAWSEALAIPEFASADFVGKDDRNLPFLTATEVRKWLGITWIMHTGLPLANADDRTCFVYHKTAVGLAIGADITTDISWHGDRAAHFVNNWMSMGACLIDAAGVVEIRVDDDTAIG